VNRQAWTVMAGLCFFVAPMGIETVKGAASETAAGTNSIRYMRVGNSLTGNMRGLTDCAKQTGFAIAKGKILSVSEVMAAGTATFGLIAPYQEMVKNGMKEPLDKFPYDFISLQPFGNGTPDKISLFGECHYQGFFYRDAIKGNPDVQLLELCTWPKNPYEDQLLKANPKMHEGVKNSDWTGYSQKIDILPEKEKMWDEHWNSPIPQPLDEKKWTGHNQHVFFEEICKKMRTLHPQQKPALIIPAVHSMNELKKQIQAGKVPGMQSIFQLYFDGIHMGSRGMYLEVCTAYAVMFKEKPHGGPLSHGYFLGKVEVSKEYAPIAWDCAWKAVTENWQLTGVKEGDLAILKDKKLADAKLDSPYRNTFGVAGLGNKFHWSVEGTLPPGLKLDADKGAIYGTPTKEGAYKVTVVVDDEDPSTKAGKETFELNVIMPEPPMIVVEKSYQLFKGKAANLLPQLTGGYGKLVWSVASGNLPAGLQLNAGTGEITGTPTANANGELTLQVVDGQKRSGTAKFQWSVTDAPTGGLLCEIYNQRLTKADDIKAFNNLREGAVDAEGFDLSKRQRETSYALRFIGYLQITKAGEYKFNINHGNGFIALSLDGQKLCETPAPKDGASKRDSWTSPRNKLPLNPGMYPLELLYWRNEEEGKPTLKVYWEGPGMAQQPIPNTFLFKELSTGTPPNKLSISNIGTK